MEKIVFSETNEKVTLEAIEEVEAKIYKNNGNSDKKLFIGFLCKGG